MQSTSYASVRDLYGTRHAVVRGESSTLCGQWLTTIPTLDFLPWSDAESRCGACEQRIARAA